MRQLLSTPLSVTLVFIVALVCVLTSVSAYVLLQEENTESQTLTALPVSPFSHDRFPVSVDPLNKSIAENPYIEWYVGEYLSLDPNELRERRIAARLRAQFPLLTFVQQLASPLTRTLVIYPGERREEVVDNFGDIMRWNNAERTAFMAAVTEREPTLAEGKFYPGSYVVKRDTSPEALGTTIASAFERTVLDRYDETVSAQVPLEQALTIASLLEREAYDFTDMRIISGIIWNRLFIDMPLQLDATLQYARGSLPSEPRWWPRVRPSDKFISSPYNTYQEPGLPPTPIANPSVESIVAALNPRETDCYFYFHDDDGSFYCTETYEEHVAKLREVFGRGR